jgi:hypothetical protein
VGDLDGVLDHRIGLVAVHPGTPYDVDLLFQIGDERPLALGGEDERLVHVIAGRGEAGQVVDVFRDADQAGVDAAALEAGLDSRQAVLVLGQRKGQIGILAHGSGGSPKRDRRLAPRGRRPG